MSDIVQFEAAVLRLPIAASTREQFIERQILFRRRLIAENASSVAEISEALKAKEP
jgi:hypothetical protein